MFTCLGRMDVRRIACPLLALGAALAAANCGSSSIATPATGALQLAITGLPSGMSAAVTITGPTGETWSVQASTTVVGVAPGDYVITAADVLAGNDRYLGAITGSPATVVAEQTSQAGVAYTKMPGASSLVINVGGLPSGVDAAITVTGPSGSHFDVGAGQVLGNLAAGTYSVLVATVVQPDPIVSPVYLGSADPSSLDLLAGQVANVDVTYARRPGSGVLWGRGGSAVTGFASEQLQHGQSASAISLATGDNFGAIGVVGGMLWVQQTLGLIAFDTASLHSNFTLPDITIGGALSRAIFDAAGNLWLLNGWTLSKLTPSQLARSGTPTPGIVVTLPDSATAGAFDVGGNFWYATGVLLKEIPVEQLAASGNVTAPISIDMTDYAYHPSALAFDAYGNLWAACQTDAIAFGIAAALLKTGGSPFGSTQVLSVSYAFGAPVDLAFDNSGDLWVSDAVHNAYYMFSVGSLYEFVYPRSPDVTMSFSNQPFRIAFDPPPPGLPLPR